MGVTVASDTFIVLIHKLLDDKPVYGPQPPSPSWIQDPTAREVSRKLQAK
jgi:hypothetical protein